MTRTGELAQGRALPTRPFFEAAEEARYVLAVDAGSNSAAEMGSRILAKIDTLKRFPERCRVIPELKRVGVRDFRESSVGPYRIFFRVDGSIVEIVGVLNERRDVEEILATRGLRR